ncbi:MAG: low molecular weight protein-tyrosine-phosphatase [Bryobacteraceae bacterium]
MIRSFLKAVLPGGVVRTVRDLSRVEAGARGTYLRLALSRQRDQLAPPLVSLATHRSVVMICHGNILRSAFAEALLKQAVREGRVPGLCVCSAGLHATPGKPADPRGVTVAREYGLDLSAHRASLLDAEMVEKADLLLVMDYRNAAEAVWRYPDARRKVVLLGRFDREWESDPVIPDPYGGDIGEVRAAYGRVAAAVERLVTSLAGTNTPA